jgi:hypothetical protein
MVGVIGSWDVLAHPAVTIRCFGWMVFFRAIAPWQGKTFLDLLRDAGALGDRGPSATDILQRCIGLELRAKAIYKTLAKRFDDNIVAGPFFNGLAVQEQYHADLLEIARAAAMRTRWRASVFNPWQNYLPKLEQQMAEVEAELPAIDAVEAALPLVIQIESSEVNHVFYAALAATDAAFVQKLKPFREAMEAHMAHLAERLPELSPRLQSAADALRERFPGVP